MTKQAQEQRNLVRLLDLERGLANLARQVADLDQRLADLEGRAAHLVAPTNEKD